jgi:dienelactone hydrolase
MSTRWQFRWWAASLALIVAGLVVAVPALDLARGAALVVRAAGLQGAAPNRLTSFFDTRYATRDLSVPSRHGALRARLYMPTGPTRRTVILTAGVHAEGIDEPRLTKLARDFAATGIAVVTPELPDLLEYRITPPLADLIEDAAAWASGQRSLAPDGRVGLVGISFSGGLSVVAAGRETLRHRLAFTVSFGGHGDLGRTLSYLCTGRLPDGTIRPPHDYGVVIILLNAAHLLVEPDQVEPLRAGIRTFLQASHLDMVDHDRAAVVFNRAIEMERTLGPRAAELLHLVNTRDVARLGPILQPLVEAFTTDPALSPERSAAPRSSVFLIHGADDNVIPAAEARLLAAHLRAQRTPLRLLVTPLITHAELDRQTSVGDIWNLLTFWGDVIGR